MQKKCMGWIAAAALAAGIGATATAAEGDAYTWPAYRSDLDYDTRANLGEIKPPTKFNNNCSQPHYRCDYRQPPQEIRHRLHLPLRQPRLGPRRAGTGRPVQRRVLLRLGHVRGRREFYPVYSFNTSCPYRDRVAQMDAMIHEGIHSMTNGYPGAKQAHWFQEAGNTWIQQDMFAKRNGVYSGMGFLNAATVIAPFMPIECYSGWLIDGTFGGPGAQGVTGKNQRSLLGGAQYSNIFPTFMGTWLGTGSVRWVYGHAYGKTTYLLETYGLDIGLGDEGVRRLITEFRLGQRQVQLHLENDSVPERDRKQRRLGSEPGFDSGMVGLERNPAQAQGRRDADQHDALPERLALHERQHATGARLPRHGRHARVQRTREGQPDRHP